MSSNLYSHDSSVGKKDLSHHFKTFFIGDKVSENLLCKLRVVDDLSIEYFATVTNISPNAVVGGKYSNFQLVWTELCLPLLPLAAANDDTLLKFKLFNYKLHSNIPCGVSL